MFNGITYIRDVRQQPRPLIIHVVQIDLATPGLSFLVTPGDPVDGHEVRAQTTSQFLDKHDLQLAINGDFFWPWWYHTIFDYYPHDNDPTDVNGFAASRGDVYSEEKADDPRPTLFLAQDNRAGIDQPIGAVYNAISGLPLIVEEGRISDQIKPDEYYAGVHPRIGSGTRSRTKARCCSSLSMAASLTTAKASRCRSWRRLRSSTEPIRRSILTAVDRRRW